jgi:hypothetical protein
MSERLEHARRRASLAKRALAGAAAAAFLATVGLARVSHPGQTASPSGSTTNTTLGSSSVVATDDSGEADDSDDSFSVTPISPSTGSVAPQVQTHVS